MYTFEITQVMQQYNYDLPSNVYSKILNSTPQIQRVKFNPYGRHFEIWTNDGGFWNFVVHYEP